MSAVEQRINLRREDARGALIGYLPAGYPDLDTCIAAAETLVNAGVDIIEFGLPYTDPVMDGPVIQKATGEALRNGFKVPDVFTVIRELTQRVDAPVVVMGYWNLILRQGVESFAARLKEAGGAGLVTPDLIPDEAEEWLRVSDSYELDRIFLAAPTSTDERLRTITELSRGFVYTVSTMGVTGARQDVDTAAQELVGRLRAQGCESSCVGLGISTGQQVREVLEYADGAIVGSAFVKALAEGGLDRLKAVAEEIASGKER